MPDPLVPNGPGLAAMRRGGVAMAIALYDTAIKLLPDMVSAYNGRGVANQL